MKPQSECLEKAMLVAADSYSGSSQLLEFLAECDDVETSAVHVEVVETDLHLAA